MILDKLLEFSTTQAMTSSALSTYSVDLSVAARDIGKGKQLYAVVVIDTAANATNAADTMKVDVRSSAAESMGTATTHVTTGTYAGSTLTAGREPIIIPIPPGVILEFVSLYYTLSTTFTSFTLSAYLAVDVQTNV